MAVSRDSAGSTSVYGSYLNKYQKTSAVDGAERVHGVLGLINLISVKPTVTARPSKMTSKLRCVVTEGIDHRKVWYLHIAMGIDKPEIGTWKVAGFATSR